MKVKMLLASDDARYTMKFSEQISKNHSDMLEVTICSNPDMLEKTISRSKVEIALIDQPFVNYFEEIEVKLPLILHSDAQTDDAPQELARIGKYRRISTIVADILAIYSKVSKSLVVGVGKKTSITAVWAPAGGVGKTTVALATATALAKSGKSVFYLNLESFTSLPLYFGEGRKSISAVFEMLESNEGDVKMLISGISTEENGITYLSRPNNYDDINILSEENIEELVHCCAALADELIVDISLPCDFRTKKVFEMAKKVLLVTDKSETAKTKLSQFINQNNVFENMREKVNLIANKGAAADELQIDSVNSLPQIFAISEAQIYKELANHIKPAD
ncbi:MAG: hypothetical protein FWC13_07385 [Oscillospiraceae bacterium]|nr:hypothetical protein [Oscillospiraceae bacterium]